MTGSPQQCLCLLVMSAVAMFAGCGDEAQSTAQAKSPGGIVVEPAELEVLADKSANVDASVMLKNRGPVSIELLEVTTRCGCMSAQRTWKPRLEPGESTQIAFSVQPMSYGVRRTSITVRTSSRDQPEITIPIAIKGPPLNPPYVRYAPDQLSKRIEAGATEATLPFSIICVEKKDEEAWFLGCECTLECVTFSAPELIEEKALDDESVRREYRVVASIAHGKSQPEQLSAMVTLKVASSSMRPLKSFPLRVTNEPVVYCTPAALVVRSPPRSYKVVVRAEEGTPFKITSAQADASWVSIEFDPQSEDDTHVLDVNVSDAGSGDNPCRVILTTTHPQSETVELTVVLE